MQFIIDLEERRNISSHAEVCLKICVYVCHYVEYMISWEVWNMWMLYWVSGCPQWVLMFTNIWHRGFLAKDLIGHAYPVGTIKSRFWSVYFLCAIGSALAHAKPWIHISLCMLCSNHCVQYYDWEKKPYSLVWCIKSPKVRMQKHCNSITLRNCRPFEKYLAP